MPTHIFVNNEGIRNDTVSIYYSDNTFIVISDRSDLSIVQSLDESKKPGIYVLMSGDKRYVGQASGSIFDRLHKHDINKRWWNKVLFFGREDGRLSKAQLDYLEAKLIGLFKDKEFDVDNMTGGNTSYIDKLSQINATSLLSQVEVTLKVAGNIDLYGPNTVRTKYEDVKDNDFIMFDGHKIVVETARKLWIDVLKYTFNKYGMDAVSTYKSDNGIPTSSKYIGLKDNISVHGTLLSRHLDECDCVIYVNYSKQSILRKIQELGNHLGADVDLSEIV